jgi:hypothetical protein
MMEVVVIGTVVKDPGLGAWSAAGIEVVETVAADTGVEETAAAADTEVEETAAVLDSLQWVDRLVARVAPGRSLVACIPAAMQSANDTSAAAD